MALVDAGAVVPLGWMAEYVQGSFALSTEATLDASGEFTAPWIGFAPQDMVVSHVGFLAGAVAGSPTVEIRIETVDASTGFPTGTLFGTDTNGTTGAVSSNAWVLQALTASATISRGQAFAVVIKYATGTSIVIRALGNMQAASLSNPYQATNTTGSTAKASLSSVKAMALGSSTTAFYRIRGMLPVSVHANNTFNNTNSAKRGLRFQVPFPTRVVGVRWWNGTNVGDFNFSIMNDAGSELSSSSTAFEGDITGIAGSAVRHMPLDSPVELAKATWYRAAFEPTSATNIGLSVFTLPSADYRSAAPLGVNQHYTTFASGSWTDSATDQLPAMDLMVDKFDDGTGSGGGAAYVIGG